MIPDTDGSTGLQVRNLAKHFPLGGRSPWSRASAYVRAVDGISFDVRPHETVSLVGESGCGKTTTAKLVLLLERPTSGQVLFEKRDIHELAGADLRCYRASVQAVFQDPWSSLNPRMRAKDIVGEPLRINQRMPRKAREARVAELLQAVGLEPALGDNYPHEFSGGMRQRVAVARALSLSPSLIVLDEPVSALDVSIRAQIVNILKDLQEQRGIAYLLIAHDLATVRYLSHRVLVMYLGEVVERSPSEELFANPLHPYTQALIAAAAATRFQEEPGEIILPGEVPSPINPPPGCRFHTRCPFAFARCTVEKPPLRELAPGHEVACHLY
jgi:oligopeptide/dipeptide ABC transporter ATP-binding protein